MKPPFPQLLGTPMVLPSLWIFVGSVVNTAREWLRRSILMEYPPDILGLVALLHVDTSRITQAEVPSSGHPDLDEETSDPGLSFPIAIEGVDLLGELERGNFPHLSFAPREPLRLADAKTGARNSPILGSVSLLYHRKELKDFFANQVSSLIKNSEQVRALGLAVNIAGGSLFAFVVRSKVGGTGSGGAMDIAILLREIAWETGLTITIVGIDLQPGSFAGSSEVRMHAVRYAADKELQAAQSGRFFKIIRRDEAMEVNRCELPF